MAMLEASTGSSAPACPPSGPSQPGRQAINGGRKSSTPWAASESEEQLRCLSAAAAAAGAHLLLCDSPKLVFVPASNAFERLYGTNWPEPIRQAAECARWAVRGGAADVGRVQGQCRHADLLVFVGEVVGDGPRQLLADGAVAEHLQRGPAAGSGTTNNSGARVSHAQRSRVEVKPDHAESQAPIDHVTGTSKFVEAPDLPSQLVLNATRVDWQ